MNASRPPFETCAGPSGSIPNDWVGPTGTSFSPKTCIGDEGDSRRFPGASSLGSPGISVHQWCPLFIAIPVRPMTTPDPYEEPSVCVMLTASPLASAAARWVVELSDALVAQHPRQRHLDEQGIGDVGRRVHSSEPDRLGDHGHVRRAEMF